MGNMCKSTAEDKKVVEYNTKASLVLGIVEMVCAAGVAACAGAELGIGQFASRGAAWGMLYLHLQPAIYAIVAWYCSTCRAVKTVYWSALVCGILNVMWFIGQIVRIIFVVGNKSTTIPEDLEATTILLYTELSLIYVTTACQGMLFMISCESSRRQVAPDNKA